MRRPCHVIADWSVSDATWSTTARRRATSEVESDQSAAKPGSNAPAATASVDRARPGCASTAPGASSPRTSACSRSGDRPVQDRRRHLSLAPCHLPPATCHLPPAACRLPPAACRLPPAACRLQSAIRNPQSAIRNPLPITFQLSPVSRSLYRIRHCHNHRHGSSHSIRRLPPTAHHLPITRHYRHPPPCPPSTPAPAPIDSNQRTRRCC